MPNIYQHIGSNKRETFVVMTVFIALVGLVGWVAGEYLEPGYGYTISLFALGFSCLSSIFSYYFSDKMVLAISKAHEVTPEQAHDLHDLVDNMSIASGIPKPKIYIIDDTAMNAFATGRDPKHGVICFTSGIVQKLEKRELEGVVAHEMSHIGNHDTLLMVVVSVLVGTIALLSDIFTRGVFYGRKGRNRESDSGGAFLIIGLVLLILSPLIATIIKLAISRNREYLADATAALITRYPEGLARALEKLDADKEILEVANSATSHLYIDDPVVTRGGGKLANLFCTHPPIQDRVARLRSM
jgi:heat shock protein HtpX